MTFKKGEDVEVQNQACIACHTFANGQNPKGPHLVDIGKRYKRAELIESVVKPSAKIAQGFDTYNFVLDTGKIITGFVVTESADKVTLRENNGISKAIPQDQVELRVKQRRPPVRKIQIIDPALYLGNDFFI